jgi:hypothetical protein
VVPEKKRRRQPRKIVPAGERRRNKVYGPTWRKVRAEVLKRDGGMCQVQIRGVCRGVADQVDHIIPAAVTGPVFDPALLRACCRPCNNVLAWQRRKGGQPSSSSTPASPSTPTASGSAPASSCPHVMPSGEWCFEGENRPGHWSRAWMRVEVAVRLNEEAVEHLGDQASPERRAEVAKAKAKLAGPLLA